DPEQTRDLLKNLYQNLMPRKLRHALGEYYTPDWLAERVLSQLGVQGDPDERLLDPGCGSGTFPVLTIRRVREYAAERMLPEAEVLEKILRNVVGFDLNPLAVIAARTNYLMALGDLVQHRRGEISIPVYLADSIMTPSTGETLFDQHSYGFKTAVGEFAVPRSLVSARAIDELAVMLEECVEIGLTAEQFRARLLSAFPELAGKENELAVAEELYGRLRELDEQGINGIWARIIKNAFAPLFVGEFDYVAGNPPWVNWESLPDEYRQETSSLWAAHDLFPHKGFDAILGGSKDDISILMTYVALDKYLRDGGRLGFLITQSVFKTAGAGQGFRRFRLGDGTPLKVLHVDDMSELTPFPGVGNRTAIVVLQKGRETEYPVPYTFWQGEEWGRGRRRTIPEDLSPDEVQEMTVRSNLWAEPVDDEDVTSSWISGRRRALSAVRKVLGASDYRARAGVCTWMNAVYWLEVVGERPDGLLVITNILKGAKRKVEKVQTAIEPDLVYPLLRGRDVNRWRAGPSAHILVTHRPEMGLQAVSEDEMVVRFPKACAYLKRFEDDLRNRSGYRRYFTEEDPFYSLFDIGDYTFAPYKVVWRGQVAPNSTTNA
ncbi:MAG: N-6 DNA methylase, partial [Anaerolineae bacterium]